MGAMFVVFIRSFYLSGTPCCSTRRIDQVNHIRRFVFSTVSAFAVFNAKRSSCITIFVLAYVADQVDHIRRFVFSTVSAFAVFNAERRYCITIFLLAFVIAQVNHIRRLMLFAKQMSTLNQSIVCTFFMATIIIT